MIVAKEEDQRKWYYRDSKGNIQGPYDSVQMLAWSQKGHFDETLQVRHEGETEFRSLGDAMKDLGLPAPSKPQETKVRLGMMPDLSKYVRRDDKVNINNSVKLVIGETVIETNGIVLGQHSLEFKELVLTRSELFLDNFVGLEDGVQDCIELIYGGEVVINKDNIKAITKFSAVYKISIMYRLAWNWIKDNLSFENLCEMLDLGLLIEDLIDWQLGEGKWNLLNYCKDFIVNNVKDDLTDVLGVPIEAKRLIKFLIQAELLYYSLPVITSWVSNDCDVKLVLEEIELKGLVKSLSRYETRTAILIEKMSSKMESIETSRLIIKLQTDQLTSGETVCYIEQPTSSKQSSSMLDFRPVEDRKLRQHEMFKRIQKELGYIHEATFTENDRTFQAKKLPGSFIQACRVNLKALFDPILSEYIVLLSDLQLQKLLFDSIISTRELFSDLIENPAHITSLESCPDCDQILSPGDKKHHGDTYHSLNANKKQKLN